MRRVRNRFFSMWDFLSLKGGIRDFNEKWARDLGLKVWSNNNGYATATKTSIKKWGHAASNSISLFPSRSIRQVLAIFCELNSKRLYQSSGEKKESCCLVFTPPQNVKLGNLSTRLSWFTNGMAGLAELNRRRGLRAKCKSLSKTTWNHHERR